VIIAIGVRPKLLARLDPGVALEYWDDARVRRGDGVAVIGGGEIAFDQACSLAGRGASVDLLMRGRRPRAHALLVRDAAALGVRIWTQAVIRRIECAGRHCLITLGGGRSLLARHLLPAIGCRAQLPQLSAAARRLLGKGLFIAGDTRPGSPRQAAAAFGDGVAAAMRAYEHLRGRVV
jgi:thioredoxin reductase